MKNWERKSIKILQDRAISAKMLELISSAEKEIILISSWLEKDNPILNAIIGAHHRNVHVEIVTRYAKSGIQREALDYIEPLGIIPVFKDSLSIYILIVDKIFIIFPQQNFTRNYDTKTSKIALFLESREGVKEIMGIIENSTFDEDKISSNSREMIQRTRKQTIKSESSHNQQAIDLNAAQKLMYEKLRRWRLNQAELEHFAPYVIAHNKHLVEMIVQKCNSFSSLGSIKGFGQKRAQKYGEKILEILNNSETPIAHKKKILKLTKKSPIPPKQMRDKFNPAELEEKTLDLLKRWRLAQANKEGVVPTNIVSGFSLKKAIKQNCKTIDEVIKIPGLGPEKGKKYGEAIIKIINSTKNVDDDGKKTVEKKS
jgi:hypothetical protein